MAIVFNCPHCGAQTNVDDRYAGQSGPCRTCGQAVTVPGSPFGAAGIAPPAPKSSSATTAVIVIACVGGLLFLCVPILIALLLPAVQAAREAARRAQCTNNLKQIGVALHVYHDLYGSFPPAYIADADGKPMHSWRVLILPFVEGQHIYDQYNFNEPWNGPNNRRLAAMMPSTYSCPSDPSTPGASTTAYLAIAGPGAVFDGDKRCTLNNVTDGTENTLVVGEVVGANVDWMEPRDLELTQMSGTINAPGGADISSHHPSGAMTLYADGSVHFLPSSTTPTTIRALSTKAGGEPISGLR
ncbi:MAG TPA: DUF1559 domain-containing protein, partial [Pirellulales bacterium]|jgi:prepilin-type processing-associated H-X9-DG protein|nr:DUF1559 domain-containing protein [Pirellulales bacterium]